MAMTWLGGDGAAEEWVFARLERHLLIVSDLFWHFFVLIFSGKARRAHKNGCQISETKTKYTYAEIKETQN